MTAYFVTRQEGDTIVIPEAGVATRVDGPTLRRFLDEETDFASWQGEPLGDRKPEAFGRVIATRDDDASPKILDQGTWNTRVMTLLRLK